ncbi:hypothetical protein Zm00014a_038717 [Zea mays]|uniref:Secreted protein n=1 Tax=Zea mays TaxID=4577 RepID=A0A3L6DD57_MAIZE|nr:hypothetical protein Zm00014a_038717 [Zea mays]
MEFYGPTCQLDVATATCLLLVLSCLPELRPEDILEGSTFPFRCFLRAPHSFRPCLVPLVNRLNFSD